LESWDEKALDVVQKSGSTKVEEKGFRLDAMKNLGEGGGEYGKRRVKH
jgi:hypothetical protein